MNEKQLSLFHIPAMQIKKRKQRAYLAKAGGSAGRPPMEAKDRRVYSIRPGFTRAEMSALESSASAYGLAAAEYLRRVAIGLKIYSISKMNREAVLELARLRSSLRRMRRQHPDKLSMVGIDDAMLDGLEADILQATKLLLRA